MVASLKSSLSSNKSLPKAQFPPNITTNDRDPNTRDYFNFTIGDLWINKGTTSAPLQRVWILVNQANHVATWVLIINGGGGPVVGLQPQVAGVNNGAVVNPALGIININNTDTNVVPSNGGGNTLNINLANNLTIVGTIVAGSAIATINGGISAGSTTNNTNPADINLIKSRAGGIVLNGDSIGAVNFLGNDGVSSAVQGARILGVVDGAPAAGSIPTRLSFWTTPVGGAFTQRMSIFPAGNVNILTPDSGIGLNVAGGGISSLATFGAVGNGTGIPCLVDNTGLLCTVASSLRYKENINDMGSSSDFLMKLRPVIFNYKKDELKLKQFGLIAEEVADVYPDLVAYDSKKNMESVKYHELVPLMLNEIQKLNTRIKILEGAVCCEKVS